MVEEKKKRSVPLFFNKGYVYLPKVLKLLIKKIYPFKAYFLTWTLVCSILVSSLTDVSSFKKLLNNDQFSYLQLVYVSCSNVIAIDCWADVIFHS